MKTVVISLAALAVSLAAFAEPKTSDQVLAEAEMQARAEHKHILLHFGASWCGWCKRLDTLLERPEVKPVFEKYFVPVKLVVQERGKNLALENPGAQALMQRLGAVNGLPFMTFVDAKGTLIVNSIHDGANIGYPVEPAEIDWFIEMVRKAAPAMSDGELKTIETVLRARQKK